MRAALPIETDARSAWLAEARATAVLAWPVILTQLLQISITTTDVVMMGWIGTHALAVGAIGVNVYFIPLMFGFGIVLASAPLMAQVRGANRHEVRDVRRTLRMSLWAAFLVAIPAMLVMWHAQAVLLVLGQDAVIAADAHDYVRALMWGFPAALWFNALRQFTASLERPRPALYAQIVTFVVNAALCYVLMFGHAGMPALGVVGAGIASAIANWVSVAILLAIVLLDRRMRRYHILGRIWRFDPQRFVELFRIGVPIALTVLLEVTIFSGAVYLMGIIGTPELAAHQIVVQCASMTFMVPLGVAQAATVRVGLHAGARDIVAIARAGWTAMLLGFAFMSSMGLLFALGGVQLATLFLDPARDENRAVIALAAQYFLIAAAFQIFDGAQTIALGALRGLKDTRVPMVFAAIGYWIVGIGIGIVLAFSLDWRGIGVWIGLAAGLAFVAITATWRFMWRARLGLLPA
jgi:MATE family multidrug resistance protein